MVNDASPRLVTKAMPRSPLRAIMASSVVVFPLSCVCPVITVCPSGTLTGRPVSSSKPRGMFTLPLIGGRKYFAGQGPMD